MQVDRRLRNGSWPNPLQDGFGEGGLVRAREEDGFVSSSASSSSCSSSPMSPAPGANSIEHRVSKMDTLAGVAIKYGVEVADIKKMNGLVTDIQMFAHKSLQIPLPGRHPPSPIMSNGSSCNGDHTPPPQQQPPQKDVRESLRSLRGKPPQQRVSPAMRSLQGYYGLTPPRRRASEAEGTEMAVYKTGTALNLEGEPLSRISPTSRQRPNCHRKSRSLVNELPAGDGASAGDGRGDTEDGEADRTGNEKSVRRRQKMEIVSSLCRAPELVLKEEEDVNGAFSGRRPGKGPALRPKSGSRTDPDSSRGSLNTVGDSSPADGFFSVRRSSSTSNLQESDGGASAWPTPRWSLKPDAITKPIFVGLPKPTAAWRNKAAVD